MKALKSLADDPSIVITQADKGGGVVIIDKFEYVTKMNDLLEDKKTYTKKNSGFIEKSSKRFNQEARKKYLRNLKEENNY